MPDNVKIDLEDNSKYRVALDLAYRIAHDEKGSAVKDRAYWLTLYAQCSRAVVQFASGEDALKQK